MNQQSGSSSLELVLLTPVFLAFLALTAIGGRITTVRNDVVGAVQDAARVASLGTGPTSAAEDARDAARSVLGARQIRCQDLDVEVDTAELRPGGRVAVTIRCNLSLEDLALFAIPGSRTITASATEPVDRYRAGP